MSATNRILDMYGHLLAVKMASLAIENQLEYSFIEQLRYPRYHKLYQVLGWILRHGAIYAFCSLRMRILLLSSHEDFMSLRCPYNAMLKSVVFSAQMRFDNIRQLQGRVVRSLQKCYVLKKLMDVS